MINEENCNSELNNSELNESELNGLNSILIEDNEICSICLENIDNSVSLICQHKFCNNCFRQLKKFKYFTCPICRGPAIEMTIHEIQNGVDQNDENYIRRVDNYNYEYRRFMIQTQMIDRIASQQRRDRELQRIEERAKINFCCFSSAVGIVFCCLVSNSFISI